MSESQLQTYHNDIAALHVPLVAGKNRINFLAHDLMQGQLMLLHFQSFIFKSQIQAILLFGLAHRAHAWLHVAPCASLVADKRKDELPGS